MVLPAELVEYIETLAKTLRRLDLFKDIRSHGKIRELKREVLQELKKNKDQNE